MTRVCKHCGAEYEVGSKQYTYLCPACSMSSRLKNVMRERVCKQCGASFNGGPRAMYCPDCRSIRKSEADLRFYHNKAIRPLGSTDKCKVCGGEYIVTSSRQLYCKDCSATAVKAVDRMTSLEWQRKHADAIRPVRNAARKRVRYCVICGEIITSPTPVKTCSPECARKLKSIWQARGDLKRGKRKL